MIDIIIISTILIILLPLKYSIYIWILLTNFDIAGSTWESGSSTNLINSIRILLPPLLIFFKIRNKKAILYNNLYEHFKKYEKILVLIFVLVIFSFFYKDSHLLSGMKFFGYITVFLFQFILFASFWYYRVINLKGILVVFFITILIAITQTFFFNQGFGGYSALRFTTFTSPQSYGQFLVGIFCLLLFYEKISPITRTILLSIVLTTIILTGSRSALIGIIAAYFIYIIILTRLNFIKIFLSSILIFVFTMFSSNYLFKYVSNRFLELFFVISSYDIQNVSTFAFRLSLWDVILGNIQKSSWFELLLGHGISSGSKLVLQNFYNYTTSNIDGNRLFHNEFLRIVYEFGFSGLLLFLILLFYYIYNILKSEKNSFGYSIIAFLPFLFLTLFVENILASSGSPGGIMIAMIFTSFFHFKNNEEYL